MACSCDDKAAPLGGSGADTGSSAAGATVEPGEWLPGGDTTNTRLFGRNSFTPPAQNLSDEAELAFYSGNAFFNQAWIEAPASTTARDGLGPLFNARSCSSCHPRDGRGEPPDDGEGPLGALLLRLSVELDGNVVEEPVYGEQLQDQANPGIVVEATPIVRWESQTGEYPDGSPYELIAPTFTFTELGYGPMHEDVLISPRIAPQVIGLGLLEAIPESRLLELSDPEDDDGDGISGRIQRVSFNGQVEVGRFGWKGDAANVEHQVAAAFSGDMGLTSPPISTDDCTEAQTVCNETVNGGDPEVDEGVFERIVIYTSAVAVPARRKANDATILKGKALFREVGCDDCHTPKHTTGPGRLPAFEDQLIWPYTDLLLHDMGDGLADQRPVGQADGREWKTPPLWGLGLVEAVNGHTRFLHDGRARSLEEAILWHGGEGEPSRNKFTSLDATDRQSLLAFVRDL